MIMNFKFSLIVFYLLISVLSVVAQHKAEQAKEARNVERFGTFACEDMKARLDNFEIQLYEESQSNGLVIVYEGKHSKYNYDRKGNSTLKFVLPRFGESAFLTQEMQNYLKFRKIPIGKFLFIDGGFRKNFEVEFWIVPNGAKLPKPTPTLETMKYRKGTLRGICREF